MNSVSSLTQQTNPYEQYVQQLVQLESQKKIQLQDEKTTLDHKQSVLSDVSSVVSDFNNTIDELTGPASNSFSPLKASSSDEEAVTVDSIAGMDETSAYDITVDRTASRDIMLSNIKDGTATDLAGSGDGTVDITIGDKTETISVSTTNDDGTTKTNKEIFDSFSTAINNKLGNESDSNVLQVDNDGNVQISIKSAQTGTDERIQFNNATGVLGQVTGNMTHNTPTNELDAQFTIDGATFTRGQDTVDDAIPGMTFTLQGATGTQEQISVTKDTDTARDNIDKFISSFNKLNSKVREESFVDGQSGEKGTLQDMRSIRNLSIQLRQTALTDMGSAGAGEIANLSELGIGFENDGTMTVEDSDKLDEVLNERPDEVNNLFSNDDSPIQAMYDQAETYTQPDGVISALESGLDQRMDRINNRIESENKYLERYEERQRQTFAELYQVQQQSQRQLSQVQSQQSMLGI